MVEGEIKANTTENLQKIKIPINVERNVYKRLSSLIGTK